ncbi:MAG TPA: ribonuclease R, partial [Candidatus Syntrophosphaera thermopropionivorans]|nr:ribonuclease R [Candidatus Syntrophosphaera thermopropionivorans]
MKNTNLSDRIEQTFIENNNTPLSYNELVNELHLVRREKLLLGETLQAMVAEGILIKKNRKFRLAVSPDQLKKETYEPVSHPRLLEGIFDATPLARDLSYAFVRTEKGDFYINSEDTLNAYHNDIVAIEPHFRKGKPDYAIVRKIIKRANETMTGDIRESGSRTFFISINPKIHNWIEVSDLNGAKEGDKVVLEVTNWGNQIMGRMPVGKVIEILGPSGDPEVELLAVIRQYNLPLQFPETVIAEM